MGRCVRPLETIHSSWSLEIHEDFLSGPEVLSINIGCTRTNSDLENWIPMTKSCLRNFATLLNILMSVPITPPVILSRTNVGCSLEQTKESGGQGGRDDTVDYIKIRRRSSSFQSSVLLRLQVRVQVQEVLYRYSTSTVPVDNSTVQSVQLYWYRTGPTTVSTSESAGSLFELHRKSFFLACARAGFFVLSVPRSNPTGKDYLVPPR